MAAIEFATWPNTVELCFGVTQFSKPDLLKYLNSHGVVVNALDMLHEVPDASQKVFMVVFKSSSEHQLFLSRHGRKQIIKVRGQDLVVSCSDKSLNYKRVRICKLPPVINSGIVKTRLSAYGKIEGEVEWETYKNFPERKDLKTGWLIINMTVDRHIPSYTNIGPYRCFVTYEGQPKTCRQCDSPDHMWVKCPIVQERFNKRSHKPTLNEQSSFHVSGGGTPGAGPARPTPPTIQPQAPLTEASAPQPAPQAQPEAPPSPQPEAPAPSEADEPAGPSSTKKGGKKVKNVGISTWRRAAAKAKPNLKNCRTAPLSHADESDKPVVPEKRSASIAELQAEPNKEPARPRADSGSTAQLVRASSTEQEAPRSIPGTDKMESNTDDVVLIEETQRSSINDRRNETPGGEVSLNVDPPSTIDLTLSPGIPLTLPGEGTHQHN